MPRSIWNGVISFGMVSIPVKLFTATESKDVSFHLLHKKDNARLRQLRVCTVDDEEVEWGDIVRGYEYARDQHVVLDEEDFEKLPLPSKHTIELSAFVNAEEIDPIYYEKSYYLEPDETGVKPFALLMKALKEKKLTAVAKIAIRNKERLCALRAMDGALVLETLLYSDEIRQTGSEIPDVEVSDRELEMANALIDLLTESFDPEKYHDEYRDALMQVIEAKLQGQEIVEAPAAAPAKVVDLMAALKESVEAAKKRADARPSERKDEAEEETPRRRRKAG
jgi:DNA end-binding protein Ku